ncbi:MAG TPA: methyl-accepting chemotaxis protein [Nostocaceae cyanobacterium]|nr:methyl-accepting chemotaxis protein [Nostocaceae cyanobacterium]
MATKLDDYDPTYEQAMTAYVQQEYEVAANLVDQAVQNAPDDPNSHLLRGHIYYVLQQYNIARSEYEQVLNLTNEPETLSFAHHGLDNINQYLHSLGEYGSSFAEDLEAINGLDDSLDAQIPTTENLSNSNPFDIPLESINFDQRSEIADAFGDNPFDDDPFALSPQYQEPEENAKGDTSEKLELPQFWPADSSIRSQESKQQSYSLDPEVDLGHSNGREFGVNDTIIDSNDDLTNHHPVPNLTIADNLEQNRVEKISMGGQENWLSQTADQKELESTPKSTNDMAATWKNNSTLNDQQVKSVQASEQNSDDNFDIEAFESAFGADGFLEEESNQLEEGGSSKSNIEFLDDFDDFDDLGNIPGFELTGDDSFSDVAIDSLDDKANLANQFISESTNDREEELFTITGSQESVPVFTQTEVSKQIEVVPSVEPGLFSFFENASLDKKPWFIGIGVAGIASIVAAVVTATSYQLAKPEQRQALMITGSAGVLGAGLASGITAGLLSSMTLWQIRRTTKDLQSQFESVRQGNLNVQATVFSEDELGYLAAGFNDMSRVIFTTTNEAQRKAQEQEEAKENLQRQVIRLLDDVEGAARGDLTVQAEVTADVLGAVADAFNLTIQNLRDIVQQVKIAAREVTRGATNSETFARALSSDALRQAEELGVTLSSVQAMTRSIERVAKAAKEAETVARDASAIALKGGEAVENTVAGILEIRETVAETTRKVKRLAESSQEISKIVALISQIASRTNLLALNASIEAARAGEAGRGFAIVADEVRQLADKSAKSLKEIEQIVMQIQGDTGSVMTAMEEGTQQVIEGTKLAEEAKRSLEDIIQVANHIDTLVRSITSDTVQQTETSFAVAQVMQSVELTAQETSQEAQRVSGALQHLVGVSRDLITSVERFRVETVESR